ncbi:MAG: hypothetical protein ACRC67_40905 [Inquilinus sp.]|uniref:hypothetical protein n=1 Tax=Inquilinus sp. TaxID=1932117 RepID=UPI003F414DBD
MTKFGEFSVDDLAAAEAELAALVRADANDRSNNPDKYRSDIKRARLRVEHIVLDLKSRGLMPKSPQELLNAELDRLFPRARSRDVVEHDGKTYRKRFFPRDTSHSGRVTEWAHSWELVKT